MKFERETINKYFAEILEKLVLYIDFTMPKESPWEIFDETHKDEIASAIYAFSEEGIDLEFHCGATKCVIMLNGTEIGNEYVAKIPIRGLSSDYCDAEVNTYDLLCCENDFENYIDLFCECWRGGCVGDIPFYVMERADVDSERFEELSFKSWSKSCHDDDEWDEEEINDNFSFLDHDEYLLYALMELLGDEDGGKFFDLLQLYDIRDLHDQNIGFINGQMKIIDYSGYWE